MKIRVTGIEKDIKRFVEDMEQYYDVISVSPFYKNDRKVQKSKEGRVYIHRFDNTNFSFSYRG